MIRTRGDQCPHTCHGTVLKIFPRDDTLPYVVSPPPPNELTVPILPDFRESHIGIDILKPGLVATFHVCKLAKEKLLFCVG